MNVQTKHSASQAHQLVLYRRALHPELFPLKARRAISGGAGNGNGGNGAGGGVGAAGVNTAELEAWIMPGSHLVRFRFGALCACELITDLDAGLPSEGAVAVMPCLGEQEYEHTFEGPAGEVVKYSTAMQTETLNENLYRATYREMVQFAAEIDGLLHEWTDAATATSPGGSKNLSLIELQRYGREFHAQGYHLLGANGFVLRTQTMFTLPKNAAIRAE